MPHQIYLSPEEDRTLLELSKNTMVPTRVRQRAEALRLSARNWTVPRIAEFLDWHAQTVRETFHRWWDGGLDGLFEAPGRGAPARWTEQDIVYLETRLMEEEQTYQSKQLAELLFRERGVCLSAFQLRKVLKKRALSGNAHAKVLLEQIRSSRHKKRSS